MIKRESWINHGIPCPERGALLKKEIKYWVNQCTTADLIELLPLVARKAEEELRTDPMVECPLKPGEDPLETKPGLILIDDGREEDDSGSNGKLDDTDDVQ